jgi:possible transcriptional regulator
MTEKYKIYIPEEMRLRLLNDAELFDFYKKDGSVNLNGFLKELLLQYFDEYRKTKEMLLDTILSDLSAFSSISREDADAIADKIMNSYMRNTEFKSERNAAITLTVSGRSLDIMHSIENNMLSRVSLSQYLNDFFSSYLSISRKDRERILFQDIFEELNTAIRKNSIIRFTSTSAPKVIFTVQPYCIAASKEEQCNYLLCTDHASGIPRTFRISRIHALFTSSDKFLPDESRKAELQEIAGRSPQAASKSVEAKVLFTDKGMQKFHLVTKNRPDVLKKEGNTLYFHWPRLQLEAYFRRFGKEAVILEPDECRESMRFFYKKAWEAYRKKEKSV